MLRFAREARDRHRGCRIERVNSEECDECAAECKRDEDRRGGQSRSQCNGFKFLAHHVPPGWSRDRGIGRGTRVRRRCYRITRQ